MNPLSFKRARRASVSLTQNSAVLAGHAVLAVPPKASFYGVVVAAWLLAPAGVYIAETALEDVAYGLGSVWRGYGAFSTGLRGIADSSHVAAERGPRPKDDIAQVPPPPTFSTAPAQQHLPTGPSGGPPGTAPAKPAAKPWKHHLYVPRVPHHPPPPASLLPEAGAEGRFYEGDPGEPSDDLPPAPRCTCGNNGDTP